MAGREILFYTAASLSAITGLPSDRAQLPPPEAAMEVVTDKPFPLISLALGEDWVSEPDTRWEGTAPEIEERFYVEYELILQGLRQRDAVHDWGLCEEEVLAMLAMDDAAEEAIRYYPEETDLDAERIREIEDRRPALVAALALAGESDEACVSDDPGVLNYATVTGKVGDTVYTAIIPDINVTMNSHAIRPADVSAAAGTDPDHLRDSAANRERERVYEDHGISKQNVEIIMARLRIQADLIEQSR